MSKSVFYSFISLLVSDMLEYLGGTIELNFNPVFITAFLKVVSLYYLISYSRKSLWKNHLPRPARIIFKYLIFWNIVTIIRGALSAEDYWDWRFLGLSSFFYFFIPYAVVIGIMFFSNAHLFRFIIKKLFVFAFFLVPLSIVDFFLYARTVISAWLFILLNVYLHKKLRLIILATAFFSVLTGFEIRANALRILVAFILFLVYFLRGFIKTSLLKALCFIIFFAPLVFVSLGISGKFNIFQPFNDNEESFVVVESGKESSNLVADTRTGLYTEVLNSMLTSNTLILGGGATAKYKSSIIVEANNDRGRYGAEVGFLNTLLYSGIVGVLLYLLILLCAAYYALYQSNNFFCKLLAVFLAFRWDLFFVEDITRYDMNFYFLWIAVGMCFSNQFRGQTDFQIKNWVAKFIQG